ncbi:metallophosphoesterase [Moraxella sp. Tifton1]|uniref:metallophosphoesterase n=1 Tax=Moraxella oculi TaxID=2940516 RepID=UPI002011CF36|nr:metallophosphoesterase [Moraxella sp. Tifton1]MCL1623256.1 metallophosphoesterase [Moraxella sp. Tifton1]
MKHASKILVTAAILAALTAITLIAIDDRLIKQDYTASHVNSQHEITIAIITDLHSCFYGDEQKEIINPLKNRRPDVILLGGDIYDDDLPPTHTDILLRQLTKITPNVYYVNGNHELYLPAADYANIENKIKSYGITILHGESTALSIDGKPSNIHIHGVSDPVFIDKFNQDLRTVGNLANSDHINILLTHRPEYINDYLQYPFDFVVSGHAHGGQWRIPYILNGLFAPDQGLFPKYAGGSYHFDNQQSHSHHTQLIVSRGLAKESTRFIPRIFNRPELVFLTIPNG